MSNDITANPLYIDTAAAGSVTTITFVITKVRWVGATTAGHTVSVRNGNSQVLFAAEATGANYTESEHFDPPLIVESLIVPTLASGILYIYCKSKIPIT